MRVTSESFPFCQCFYMEGVAFVAVESVNATPYVCSARNDWDEGRQTRSGYLCAIKKHKLKQPNVAAVNSAIKVFNDIKHIAEF